PHYRRLPGDRGRGRPRPAPGRPGPPRNPPRVRVRRAARGPRARRGRPGLERPGADRVDVGLGLEPGAPADVAAERPAVEVAALEMDAAVTARHPGPYARA